MAIKYKVLGQAKPSAATLSTLYTVPSGSGNYAVVSTITILNISSTPDEVRVAVRPGGASIADQHYIVYGTPVSPYQSLSFTIGVTADQTDVVSVYSKNGTTSFNLFGSENS